MKLNQILLLSSATVLMSACATSSATKQGGAISPNISDVNAHIELGKKTAGTATISTFEIFGLKFHSDASGKRFSGLSSNLVVPAYSGYSSSTAGSSIPGEAIINNGLGKVSSIAEDPLHFLFGSPASTQAALSAARYEAVESSQGDGIIETKAKADTTGFSLLHFIGWGTANAQVEGQAIKVAPGELRRAHVTISK